jgi:hypothetical protein
MRLDSTCSLPETEAVWLSRVRAAYNAGLLDEGIARVVMPSPASYERQYREGMRTKAERDAARAAAEEAARAEAEVQKAHAEEEAAAGFMESPELVEAAERAHNAEAASHDVVVKAQVEAELEKPDNEKTAEEIVADRIAEEAHLHELMEEKYATPEADFALDYSEWCLEYNDGSSVIFDWNESALAEESLLSDENATEGAAAHEASSGASPIAEVA